MAIDLSGWVHALGGAIAGAVNENWTLIAGVAAALLLVWLMWKICLYLVVGSNGRGLW